MAFFFLIIDQIAYDNSTQTKENIFQLKENENDIREIKKFVGFMDQKIMKGFEELVVFELASYSYHVLEKWG